MALEMAMGKGQVLSSIYKWEIDNYFACSDLETGKSIHSPKFSVCSSSWYLELYPNGENKDAQGYISLFLTLIEDTEIQARFVFSLINSKKKVIATHDSKEMFSFSKQKGWGRDFENKSLLANNASISTLNKITIVCEVIIKEAKSYKRALTISPDRIQHFKKFKSLLNNPKFSDVKFKVQNKEILAHKMALAAHSSVFAAMFEHKMRENVENIVIIEDISHEVFNELLSFVYTGECTLSKDIVSGLFEAADKYQLLKLKDMCEEELCKNISVNNVMGFLQLADMHSGERLKKEAIDFIALHGKEIIKKPEFETFGNLNTELLKDVFRGIFASKNTKN